MQHRSAPHNTKQLETVPGPQIYVPIVKNEGEDPARHSTRLQNNWPEEIIQPTSRSVQEAEDQLFPVPSPRPVLKQTGTSCEAMQVADSRRIRPINSSPMTIKVSAIVKSSLP